MFDLASAQPEAGQTGIPGVYAFLQQAIRQLKPDIRAEVLQVKPAGDPDSPQPHPVRINIRGEPPAQDVADDARPAAAGLPPRSHGCLINRLIIGGKVEPFPAPDMVDQRLLHGRQSVAGHLGDHTRTLTSDACSAIASHELQWHQAVMSELARIQGQPTRGLLLAPACQMPLRDCQLWELDPGLTRWSALSPAR